MARRFSRWFGFPLVVSVSITLSGLAVAGDVSKTQSEADNNIPDGYILPDGYEAENTLAVQRKLELAKQFQQEPTVTAVTLAMSGVDQKPCGGYCGQASTQEIFHYKGQWSYTLDQIRVWETGLTTGCSDSSGTCLTPIRDTLNNRTPGLPWAGFYVAYHLDHSSLYNAAVDLQRVTQSDVGTYHMPLVALTNPNPPDGTPYCLPGWCGVSVSGHYLVINGYDGTYNGSDASAAIYYLDSYYNPADQHWANMNNFADSIYYKNGQGSCTSALYDIIW
jgi:hypothetical protein